MTRVISTVPTAWALRTRPHPASPIASVVVATSGPSTPTTPTAMALVTPKTTTMTQSHCREVNSDQPSRSSRTIEGRDAATPAARRGRRTRLRQMTATT